MSAHEDHVHEPVGPQKQLEIENFAAILQTKKRLSSDLRVPLELFLDQFDHQLVPVFLEEITLIGLVFEGQFCQN